MRTVAGIGASPVELSTQSPEEQGRPLVSVVVPAFNAENTIDETLDSVRRQTYRLIEIIVVDDGSTDGTVARADAHRMVDARIRIVRQQNSGVASARNHGIELAKGEFVALVDADDLWHPDKIEHQVAAILEDEHVALVVTKYCVVDEESFVVAMRAGVSPQTYQFADLCRRNFIGNGSSALMRRDAVLAVKGYDSSLRERGGQGCEDLKLYLELAEHHRIAMVPLPLTGYRQSAANMSSDGRQMLRSFDLMVGDFCRRRPELAGPFKEHRIFLVRWLFARSVTARRWQVAWILGVEMLGGPAPLVARSVGMGVARVGRKMRNMLFRVKQPPNPRFHEIQLPPCRSQSVSPVHRQRFGATLSSLARTQ